MKKVKLWFFSSFEQNGTQLMSYCVLERVQETMEQGTDVAETGKMHIQKKVGEWEKLRAMIIVRIPYLPTYYHCLFQCHFSMFVFTVHGQFPLPWDTFHVLQDQPKTSWEIPKEPPVSEASAVMAFSHMVGLVKQYGWASRVHSGVSRFHAEGLQNCHADTFWICFVALM